MMCQDQWWWFLLLWWGIVFQQDKCTITQSQSHCRFPPAEQHASGPVWAEPGIPTKEDFWDETKRSLLAAKPHPCSVLVLCRVIQNVESMPYHRHSLIMWLRLCGMSYRRKIDSLLSLCRLLLWTLKPVFLFCMLSWARPSTPRSISRVEHRLHRQCVMIALLRSGA